MKSKLMEVFQMTLWCKLIISLPDKEIEVAASEKNLVDSLKRDLDKLESVVHVSH